MALLHLSISVCLPHTADCQCVCVYLRNLPSPIETKGSQSHLQSEAVIHFTSGSEQSSATERKKVTRWPFFMNETQSIPHEHLNTKCVSVCMCTSGQVQTAPLMRQSAKRSILRVCVRNCVLVCLFEVPQRYQILADKPN